MSDLQLSFDPQNNLVLQVQGEPDAVQYRAFLETLLPQIAKMMQEKSDFLKATSNIVVPIFSNDFSKIDISTDKVFGITAKVPLLMSGNKEKILKTVQNFFQDINLTMPIEAMSKITEQDLIIIHKFYSNAH
jgi:hypothetical protein